jgi:lipooligosaccharide transport system permease protein
MALLTTSLGRAAASPVSATEATGLLIFRNYLAYRRAWYIFVSGFLEPVFYLFSIGSASGS